MDQIFRRSSNTTVLLEMVWEIVCRQPQKQRIPSDYVQYDTLKMRWLSNRLSELDKYLNRLIEAKCLRVIDDPRDGKLIRLTSEGIAVLIYHCFARQPKTKLNFKSEVCIVSFDIPEKLRVDRAALRKLLIQARYERVHKSTWVGRPQLLEHLAYFIHRQKLTTYVRVYSGKEKSIHN